MQAWVKDPDGRYRWVNRAFVLNYEAGAPSTGQGEPAIVGKTDYDLSPTFLADQFRLDDEHVLTGKPIVNRIELVGQPDGLASWHITNKIPIYDRAGAVLATAGVTRTLDMAEPQGGLDAGFLKVLAHLRDHYGKKLTNREMASVAHMSLRAFERKFLSSFHMPPQHYLRKLRLRMASRAIVFTNRSLADVALTCGFSDQSHFTREFRRHFGRTPREYRGYYGGGAEFGVSSTDSAATRQASSPSMP